MYNHPATDVNLPRAGSAAPRTQGLLEEHTKNVIGHLERAQVLLERLECIGTRLLGPEARMVDHERDSLSPPFSAIDTLAVLDEQLTEVLLQVSRAVDRLDRL